MKIGSLELIDFGCHKNASIDLSAPMTLIQGSNNTGKTFIVNAVEWILAGWTRGMTKQSDRQNELSLIRDDSKKAEVTLEINSQVIKKRRTQSDVSVYIDDQPKRQEDIYHLLNADANQIKAILDSGYFLSLKNDDRKKLLFDLLGKQSNKRQLAKLLSDRKIHEKYVDIIVPIILEQGYEKAKSHAVSERRVAKRDLEPLKTDPPEDVKIAYAGEQVLLSKINVDTVQSKLDDLQRQRDNILKQIGASGADVATLITTKEQELKELEAQKTQKESLVKEIREKYEKIKYNPTDFNKAKENAETVKKKLSGLDTLIQDYKNKIVQIAKGKGVCPVCKSNINEKDLKQKFEQNILELQERKTKYDLGAATQELLIQEDKAKSSMELREEGKQAKIEIARIEEKIESINNKLKELNSQDISKSADLEDQKEKLDKSIERGEEIRNEVAAYFTGLSKFNEDQETSEKLKEQIEQWNLIDKAMSADGIPKELLQNATKPLRKRLEKTTGAELFGFVTFDDDMNFFVNGKPEKRLDPLGSEALRLGYFIQEALSNIGGLRILILDRVDCLDLENRKLLMEFLKSVKKDYDHIILLLTSTEAKESTEDIKVYNTLNLPKQSSL